MMGNVVSGGGDAGNQLQSQDSDFLWTIIHLEEDESELGEEVCTFSHVPGTGVQAELCRAGVEHLRLLRHPNILKFLSCDLSHDYIAMVTEPVVPVSKALEGVCVEGLVMGWRGVSEALTFLHEKAGISHNNLSSECVYVSTLNSQWKVGGFEASQKHKKIDAQFLIKVASIRNAKAVPPEDKDESLSSSHGHTPSHSRDIWAFGWLILSLLEDTTLEAHVSDSLFSYIQEEMLNSDPALRPTASDVLQQPWMSTGATEIAEFLSNLTMKTKREKDEFFGTLADRLHSLPPAIVTEHLVPLLLSPLVMAEPVARERLWRHLLVPVTSSIPRPTVFNPKQVCPFLEKELYISHVAPVLLNLLESRDLHVRLVLLENISGFAPIIKKEDLVETVLPEVLVGLKDAKDDVVQATLHALADLIPLLGAEVVIGTHRKNIFADSKPRTEVVPSPSEPAPPTPVVTSPPSHGSRGEREGGRERGGGDRQERLERMREKREEQRRRRMAQEKKKLGGRVVDDSSMAETELDQKQFEDDEGVRTGSDQTPPTTSEHPQYSPSVSHDEDEPWEAMEGPDLEKETGKTGLTTSSRKTDPFSEPGFEGESEKEEWAEFGGESGWGEEGLNVSTGEESDRKSVSEVSRGATGSQNGGKSPKKTLSPISQEHSQGGGEPSSPKSVSGRSKSADLLRGRLKDDDIERLERQAAWQSAEPDFFANMEPSIPMGGGGGSLGVANGEESDVRTSSVSLKYAPSGQDEDGGGWGEEWSDFD